MEIKAASTRSTEKREYWSKHIKEWETSKLSQESYCKQAGITYGTFVYWRSQLLLKSIQSKSRQFLPIKIKAPTGIVSDALSVKIKLMTGNIISIPASLGMQEIAKLIRLLEAPNA
jgi:hypothetical protein